jgi:virginiamycin B lyase
LNVAHGQVAIDDEFIETVTPSCRGPVEITLGPHKAIWFTKFTSSAIGRNTADGQVSEYRLPTSKSVRFSIAAGPDNAVWFTENGSNKIGRIQVK